MQTSLFAMSIWLRLAGDTIHFNVPQHTNLQGMLLGRNEGGYYAAAAINMVVLGYLAAQEE